MRRLAALLSLLISASLLALPTLPLLPAQADERPAPATKSAHQQQARKAITLKAVTRQVARLHTAKIAGTTRARKGSWVTITQHLAGAKVWRYEGSARVKRGGKFNYREKVHSGTRYYRACVRIGGRNRCSRAILVRVVPERNYKITISTTANASAGSTITVNGNVRPGAAGDPLIVRMLPPGGDYFTAARGRVGAGGNFAIPVTLSGAGEYSLYVRKPRTAIGEYAYSNDQEVLASKDTSALNIGSTSATTLDAGQQISVQGNASANLIGRTIELQAFDNATTTWGAIGTAVVDGSANFTVSGTLYSAGKAVPIRVAYLETADLGGSASQTVNLTVYGWYYLYDETVPYVDGCIVETSAAINGVTYPRSVRGCSTYSEQFTEFNVSRACTTFEATAGLLDSSSTSARWSSRVIADSALKYSKDNIALGQTFPISVDISGTLRLRLEFQRTVYGTAGDSYLALGDARVRCAL